MALLDQTTNFVSTNDTASPCSDSPSWIREVIPFFSSCSKMSFRYESDMPEAINHTHSFVAFISLIYEIETDESVADNLELCLVHS